MTLEDRQKKIFFDVITQLTGHTENTENIKIGLTREQIIKRVATKIPKSEAENIFNKFRGSYLDEHRNEPTYRISASGREYYFFDLKYQAEKEGKEVELLDSNIKTGF